MDGIFDLSGVDLQLITSETTDPHGFRFDVVNNSTDDSRITGVFIERDNVLTRDYDLRQYINLDTLTYSAGSPGELSFNTFTSLTGVTGSELDGLTLQAIKASTVIPLSYVDGALSDGEDYRFAYTFENGQGSGIAVTNLVNNSDIDMRDILEDQGQDDSIDEPDITNPGGQSPNGQDPDDSVNVVPSPSAAAAGLALLGLMGLRRRR